MASRFEDEYAHMLEALGGRIKRELHVSFAAQVTRYDATKQVVDVQPLVADWFPSEGDEVEQVYLPVITSVPVVFPGAGGYRLTFPVQVGDTVLVVVQDRSHDAWQDQGGKQAPTDLRRHHLADAIAIPGLHDSKHVATGAATDHATLGKDGGPQIHLKSATIELGDGSDAVAVASKVNARLSAIEGLLTGVGSGTSQWVPVPSDGGLALKVAAGFALVSTPDVASGTVKVKP